MAAVDALADWAAGTGAQQVVTPYAPIGPVATALAALDRALSARGLALVCPLRDWDIRLWRHATRGFFQFRAGAGLG
jgi:deoxyribodipyrimidine photo-lyase